MLVHRQNRVIIGLIERCKPSRTKSAAKRMRKRYASGTCHGGYIVMTKPGRLNPSSRALMSKLRRLAQDAQRHPRSVLPRRLPVRAHHAAQADRGHHHGVRQRAAIGADHATAVKGCRQRCNAKEAPAEPRHDRDGVGRDGRHRNKAHEPHQIDRDQKIETENARGCCDWEIGQIREWAVSFRPVEDHEHRRVVARCGRSENTSRYEKPRSQMR